MNLSKPELNIPFLLAIPSLLVLIQPLAPNSRSSFSFCPNQTGCFHHHAPANVAKLLQEMTTIKQLPYDDSTHFNQFTFVNELNREQMRKYQLDKIVHPYHLEDVVRSELRYKLILKDHYTSLVFTSQIGEHELRTDLVNYNDKFEILGFATIAYDEIAEGCLRKMARLTEKGMLIKEIQYCAEEETTLETRYKWMDSGRILPHHE